MLETVLCMSLCSERGITESSSEFCELDWYIIGSGHMLKLSPRTALVNQSYPILSSMQFTAQLPKQPSTRSFNCFRSSIFDPGNAIPASFVFQLPLASGVLAKLNLIPSDVLDQ